MNKKQWFASADPLAMLHYLRGRAGERKLRLFAVACCRRFEHLFADDAASLDAIDVSERLADGSATLRQLSRARGMTAYVWGAGADPVLSAVREMVRPITRPNMDHAVEDLARRAGRLAGVASRAAAEGDGRSDRDALAAELCAIRAEQQRQIASLRSHFHYPLRALPIRRAWLTSDVLLLARGIYDERAFDRMPILADALQDAGCDDEHVLHHLRRGTEHARGSWVLDEVLGKE